MQQGQSLYIESGHSLRPVTRNSSLALPLSTNISTGKKMGEQGIRRSLLKREMAAIAVIWINLVLVQTLKSIYGG